MFYVNLMVTTRGKPTRDSQKIKERNSKHSTIENHQKEGSKRRGGEGSGTPLQYSCLENPWTGEPGRLQSMGSLRVGHD